MKRVLIIVGICLLPLIPVVLLVTGVIKRTPATVSRVSLKLWVTTDEKSSFGPQLESFAADHPYVSVKVTKIRPEEYRQRLVEGWAQGTGPDIFFVPSTWIGSMVNFATPMPSDLSISVVTTSKNIFGPQTKVTKPTVTAPSLTKMREWYVDAATSDIIRDNQIWALPLAMDTIVTYVNKDLLNNAKIFEAAQTWTELVNQITQNNLTIINDSGAIIQSGVALGTADNVPYATDLLTLLMMQNGTVMVDEANKKVKFTDEVGQEALDFYTSFARSKKATYSWNADQPNARDAFLKGKVAYYFGTYADRETIDDSGLNWTVGPMLHLSTSGDKDSVSGQTRFINVARFNVGMVSKAAATAKRSIVAWSLLRHLANSEVVPTYLQATDQLSALKTVLARQKSDAGKTIFAEQLLTARSWYRGTDIDDVEAALAQTITAVVSEGEELKAALDLAARFIEKTL